MAPSHKHTSTYEGKKYTWDVHKLWETAQHLKVTDLPIEELSILNRNCWFGSAEEATVEAIGKHCVKALAANLDFPIILNVDGIVMDGAHRVLKCLMDGKKTIKAVQFEQMPAPDLVSEIE